MHKIRFRKVSRASRYAQMFLWPWNWNWTRSIMKYDTTWCRTKYEILIGGDDSLVSRTGYIYIYIIVSQIGIYYYQSKNITVVSKVLYFVKNIVISLEIWLITTLGTPYLTYLLVLLDVLLMHRILRSPVDPSCFSSASNYYAASGISPLIIITIPWPEQNITLTHIRTMSVTLFCKREKYRACFESQ